MRNTAERCCVSQLHFATYARGCMNTDACDATWDRWMDFHTARVSVLEVLLVMLASYLSGRGRIDEKHWK